MSQGRSRPFRCLVMSPGGLEHPGPALPAARAGATALLDLEWCSDRDLAQADRTLRTLVERAPRTSRVGVRVAVGQGEAARGILQRLESRPHTLILCGGAPDTLPPLMASLAPHPAREILVEVVDAEQARALACTVRPIDGLVVCGNECGGRVGETSSFVLLQQIVQLDLRHRLFVRGGFGVHGAAACRVAGAAGVVLDDPFLLMPESPLPPPWRARLENLGGQEAGVLGEHLGTRCRVLLRADSPAVRTLQQAERALEIDSADRNVREQRWRQLLDDTVGWGDPKEHAWPLGQAIGLAARCHERYGTTGRLVTAVLKDSQEHGECAARAPHVTAGGTLATSHGTRFPIVQGPMTRVSDTAEFALAVAEAGALPFLGLALLRGPQVRDLLASTRTRLGNRPWGVGLLGFIPPELRQEQMDEILRVPPPFALIAGGRPDQAAALEAQGIPTYLHVPVPSLLKSFFEQGARRFVFEGRECGGHVGPLASPVLWEHAVEALLGLVAPGQESEVHVLLAGGIHDGLSTAMAAAMTAPLAQRGMRVGILMGTAYLFTREATSAGAITPAYQDEALRCRHTVNLESGPGHANRCADTPFADEFQGRRLALLRQGLPADAVRADLDAMLLGRLRLASKGTARGLDGGLEEADPERQHREGMFMIGEVATLRQQVTGMEELHMEICENAATVLAPWASTNEEASPRPPQDRLPIAIVGISSLVPQAGTPEEFWRNVLAKKCAITEVPATRWDIGLYYSPDRNAPDCSISRWGGFFDEVEFDPLAYGIPPNSVPSIGSGQLLCLKLAGEALDDAGWKHRPFDRENTAVIVANGDFGGFLGNMFVTRTMLPLVMGTVPQEVLDRMPDWNEESFTGLLTNISAGRVANRFDLAGPNFTVDAACASSLTALDLGVQQLQGGRCNAALVGAIDVGQNPFGYIAFSKTQALSSSGKARTFDRDADGIVISEGAVFVVLKRLDDAERDGDRIYAVIRGTGSSGDGKAMGMTAPRPLGQMRALRRAYERCGFSASTLGMYEAHGTATPVGDRAELETVDTIMREAQASPESCALGSVKTLVGHTKTAAGLVSLMKACLALRYGVLPPHAGVERPLAPLAKEDSPLFLLDQARPWCSPREHPRRCGVSSFGFGGTNSHVVVEEYLGGRERVAPGGRNWPHEPIVLRASREGTLVQAARRLRSDLAEGAHPRLADLAFTLARQPAHRGEVACIVAESLEHLASSLDTLVAWLDGTSTAPLPVHVIVGPGQQSAGGRIAFLFPGQGSQGPHMGREIALYNDDLRGALERAEQVLQPCYPLLLSDYVYPPAAFTEEERTRHEQRLKDTHVAQPAIGAVSAGFLRLAESLGLRPDMAGGHSYGEFVALHAAGALSYDDLLVLSEVRGRLMAASGGDAGTMAAVHAAREEVEACVREVAGVVVANHNAPRQAIISGPRRAVEEAVALLQARELRATLLPVSGAFHSSLMAAAGEPLAKAIDDVDLETPRFPVYSNVTALPHASDPDEMRALLKRHLLSPVEFVREIEQMYADGARVFVEVGPGTVLSDLVPRILGDQPHVSVSLHGRTGQVRDLLIALGRLLTAGLPLHLETLFEGRETCLLDLQNLVVSTRKPPRPASAWLVSGAGVRRPTAGSTTQPGRQPCLTREEVERTGAIGTHALPAPDPPASTSVDPEQSHREPLGAVLAQAPSVSPSFPREVTPMLQSSSPHEAVPVPGPSAAMPDHVLLTAYQAYQETMRHFLHTQEEVMRHFMGGQESTSALRAAAPAAPPVVAPRAIPPAPQPLLAVHAAPTPPAPLASPAPAVPSQAALRPVVPAPRVAAPPEAPVASVATPTAKVDTPAAVLDRDSLTARLVGLISDRTGYPTDMLGLDLDVEAELGIDSIKRVEILDLLLKSLGEGLGTRLGKQVDQLTRLKSLRALVDRIMQEKEAAEVTALRQAPASSGADVKVDARDDSKDVCPRYVMRAEPRPLPAEQDPAPQGLVLVTSDSMGVARLVVDRLRGLGATPALVEPIHVATDESLHAFVDELRRRHGAVTGIIHLAGVGEAPPPKSVADLDSQTRWQVRGLMQILGACAPDLQRPARAQGAFVIAASHVGGAFGRNLRCAPGPIAAAGVQGMLKTLALEWPAVRCRTIDFGEAPASELARLVVDEMLCPGGPEEVSYLAGRRTAWRPVSAPLPRNRVTGPEPGTDWVVLVTGGASGITAEVTRSLARPGMHLVVVGRSAEPGDEPAALAGLRTSAELRDHLVAHHRKAGESRAPAAIETEVREVLHRRDVRQNLLALRAAGIDVSYRCSDVRDEAAMAALIDGIYQAHGRLDAVVHGAGVIEDRRIEDKTLPSFDRVFDTKIHGAYALLRHLRPGSLKLVVLFASTAGRFGNRGQADYAAANEAMNRMAWQMREQWPQARVISINWGPWAGMGMAGEAVNRAFRERGIIPITPAAGCRFVLDEIRHGSETEVEVIAGAGPWGEPGAGETPLAAGARHLAI